MKLTTYGLAVLSAGSLLAEDLFNGKTLDGWTVDPAALSTHWSVADGVLVGDNPDKKGSVLWTEDDYGDFELTVDFRTESPDYDSGVFLRGESHQVQIGISRSLKKDLTACIYAPIDGGASYPAVSDQVEKVHKPGEWNTLRMVAKGNKLSTWLNGEAFVDYETKKWPETGAIGLQLHAGVHQKMEFRNLELNELTTAANPRTPNVILIYSDDVGWGDLSCYGAEKIQTPHLDKLAAEGLRFTDAHCSASTCTPSRYSLLTGEMAFRKEGTGILPGNAKMAISPDQFTLPDVFKAAGYTTGGIGKWHLGLGDGKIDWNGEIKPGPRDLGFDYIYLMAATNDRVPSVYIENERVVNLDPADPITVVYNYRKDARIPDDVPGTAYPDGRDNPEAMTYYKNSHGHNQTVINGIGRIGMMKGGQSALWDDETMSEEFLGKAREFVGRHKDEPFFLYFGTQTIHVPRVPNEKFKGKSSLAYRGDVMLELDWTVGEIMKMLREEGLDENTVVIFSSDNGPVYDDGYEDGTTVQTSTQEADNGHDGSGPYRGGKYQIFEGGNRVPFIMRWPGHIQPGVSDALISQVDLLASTAAWLGVEVPAGHAIDSRDYGAALVGKDPKGAEIILEQARTQAIRQGDWKYFEQGKQNQPHLYYLAEDPGEQFNLAGEVPDKASELAALLAKYRKQGLAQ
ncbi:sulfatase-like hydrolase/transferase [Roseibacillus ishigakijimensis]|uniref:Sulfatase-like hydrolase/transferase n=1 Tax=Roseibacillus ishigakijimensis TaxID=454146 RepID=A0A934VKL1_9BACT|nr:sulfatase-like hydrolase/transferase [Roseibacillus ishigakijimensis]MBK1833764.1 sulfatase-like hydrolase/transferase [Roseibacillus ishigakijimensis]